MNFQTVPVSSKLTLSETLAVLDSLPLIVFVAKTHTFHGLPLITISSVCKLITVGIIMHDILQPGLQ